MKVNPLTHTRRYHAKVCMDLGGLGWVISKTNVQNIGYTFVSQSCGCKIAKRDNVEKLLNKKYI